MTAMSSLGVLTLRHISANLPLGLHQVTVWKEQSQLTIATPSLRAGSTMLTALDHKPHSPQHRALR
jgi:hypothetical protein